MKNKKQTPIDELLEKVDWLGVTKQEGIDVAKVLDLVDYCKEYKTRAEKAEAILKTYKEVEGIATTMSICPTHKFAFSGKDGCQYCKNEVLNAQIAVLVKGLKEIADPCCEPEETYDISTALLNNLPAESTATLKKIEILEYDLKELRAESKSRRWLLAESVEALCKASSDIRQYKEALEFYADERNYDETEKYKNSDGFCTTSKIVEDNGELAREVIEVKNVKS